MISETDILNIFNDLFRTQFKTIDIKRSEIPEWDSMKHVELIIKIQRAFKISLRATDISNIENLKELKELIGN